MLSIFLRIPLDCAQRDRTRYTGKTGYEAILRGIPVREFLQVASNVKERRSQPGLRLCAQADEERFDE
jgi:hypothetical protein